MTIKLARNAAVTIITLIYFLLSAHATTEVADKTSSPLCHTASAMDQKLDEKSYVQIGGIKQWLTIKGDSCANPVVLLVHGGPGNPMSLFAESLYKSWEHEFTIVHWDQRGSGKTYEANQPAGEVTLELANQTELNEDLIVADGIALTNYVRQTLGKEKVIITGSSWGSTIAVKMISAHPELYNFYVGLSQMVNYNDVLLQSYQKVLQQVSSSGDEETTKMLDALGPPPWVNPRNFGKLRKVIYKLEAQASDQALDLKVGPEYSSQQSIDAYASGEELSFIKFVGLQGNGMAQRIELDKHNLEFNIPIYLIQGEADLLTLPESTKSYFDKIKAPKKKYVSVEKSAHDPNQRMLEMQLKTIKQGYQDSIESL